MQIRLDRLGEEPFTWRETLEVDAAELGRSELRALGPIDFAGRIVRVATGYWLEAELTFEQTFDCMRCLTPTVVPTKLEIASMVTVGDDEPAEAHEELQLEDDQLGVLNLREPIFDTESLLAEQLQLNIPMKPLCRDGCAGLCVTCGANLNDGGCDCAAPVDPRWSALAALRDGADRKSSD